jgi:hypothetical protein
MMIWAFLRFVLYVIVPLTAVTQVIIPTLQKKSTFPIFRSKRRKLEQELAELRSGRDDSILEEEVRKERAKAEELKKEREREQNAPPPPLRPRTRRKKTD